MSILLQISEEGILEAVYETDHTIALAMQSDVVSLGIATQLTATPLIDKTGLADADLTLFSSLGGGSATALGGTVNSVKIRACFRNSSGYKICRP